MNQAVLGLSVTYAALAALLLVIFLLSRVPVWIKLTCVVAVSGFYYLTFHSLDNMLGWPTQQQLPEQFQLLASSITEPDESEDIAGSIHIWINSFENNRPADKPRAYELPYDLELHAALDEALKRQRKGKIQLGRRVIVEPDENLPKDPNRYGQKRQRLEFYDLPDPELPEK